MAEEAAPLFLLVSQHNAKRRVVIKEASEGLAKALGFLRSELEGYPLQTCLGDKAAQAIEDFLEYEDDADDVDAVLSFVQDFALKTHKGEEIAFALKCVREAPRDANQWFTLYLKDERRQLEEQSLRNLLRHNLAGVYAEDATTGLADRITCERYLDQIANYVSTHNTKACFAVLRIDRFDKSVAHYGAQPAKELVKHVASHCKGRFREEDLVSYLGDDRIGLLLMDTLEENARMVLTRLRGSVAAHRLNFGGKPNFSLNISIAFAEMLGESGQDVMARVEAALDAVPADERSALVLAGLSRS
jgi:diguanylate cyclase (GGDEF)-like protein